MKELQAKIVKETRIAKAKIDQDLRNAPSSIRTMNNQIRAAVGPNVKINAPDYSDLYRQIQTRLGGVEIDGEKRYSPYLLDAHTQSIIFYDTIDGYYESRVHERLDKAAHFIAPSLTVLNNKQATARFQTFHSGQSINISYNLRDVKKHLGTMLHMSSQELSRALALQPELAEQIVLDRLRSTLQDGAAKKRMLAALADKPLAWDGTPTQRKLGVEKGLSVEQFGEALKAQMAAEYMVFCFDGSDIGTQYGLAQEYMTAFRRFAPMVAVIKIEHFADMYNALPTAFTKDHMVRNGVSVPIMRFDRSRKIKSGDLWNNILAHPKVQLQSPIPSGMFLQHAALYGKQDALTNYVRVRYDANGTRYFRNAPYNFVRRQLFRGYGG